MNHLERLVGEWLEFNGYFVRRNVQVAKRDRGGYDGELDVVAFSPATRHLLHVEPSMDTHPWAKREERFTKKFAMGRDHIPALLAGLDAPDELDQVALLVHASRATDTLGGGRLMLITDLMREIRSTLRNLRVERAAVPEQFPLLRTIQFCCQFGENSPAVSEGDVCAERTLVQHQNM